MMNMRSYDGSSDMYGHMFLREKSLFRFYLDRIVCRWVCCVAMCAMLRVYLPMANFSLKYRLVLLLLVSLHQVKSIESNWIGNDNADMDKKDLYIYTHHRHVMDTDMSIRCVQFTSSSRSNQNNNNNIFKASLPLHVENAITCMYKYMYTVYMHY